MHYCHTTDEPCVVFVMKEATCLKGIVVVAKEPDIPLSVALDNWRIFCMHSSSCFYAQRCHP